MAVRWARFWAGGSLLVLSVLVLALAPVVSSSAPISFAPAVGYPMQGQSIVSADVNGDGELDLVTLERVPAGMAEQRIAVLFGDGRGKFSETVSSVVSTYIWSVAAGDLTGDGHADLVAVSTYGSIVVMVGDGTGHFTPGQEVLQAGYGFGTGDLDGDGILDVVTGQKVLLGDGLGGFAVLPMPGTYGEFAIADLNGDGKADVAATMSPGSAHSYVEILLGDGMGGLTPSTLYRIRGGEPAGIGTGDLDQDGRQDLVIAKNALNDLGEWTGPGRFQLLTVDAAGRVATSSVVCETKRTVGGVHLSDLDGDGRLDLVSALLGRPYIMAAKGDGKGHLSAPLGFPVGAVPAGVAVADFNHDRLPDIAAATPHSVRVLLAGPRAAPILTGLSPAKARAGATIVLTGARFGAQRGAGSVTFGSVPATEYLSWSSTRIAVKVPESVPTGSMKVRVCTVAGRSTGLTFQEVPSP